MIWLSPDQHELQTGFCDAVGSTRLAAPDNDKPFSSLWSFRTARFIDELKPCVLVFLSISKILHLCQTVHNLGPLPVEQQIRDKTALILIDDVFDLNVAVPYRSELERIAQLRNTEAARIGRDYIRGRCHRHEDCLRVRVLMELLLNHELPLLK